MLAFTSPLPYVQALNHHRVARERCLPASVWAYAGTSGELDGETDEKPPALCLLPRSSSFLIFSRSLLAVNRGMRPIRRSLPAFIVYTRMRPYMQIEQDCVCDIILRDWIR